MTTTQQSANGESQGLFFDDFCVGQTWVTPARTITEADITGFAGFSGDFNPIHIDDGFAKASQFGQRIFHGPGVFAVATGLWSRLGINTDTAVAFLGWSLKMTAPVHIGDTIRARPSIDDLHKSTSRPDRGVVTFNVEVLNQNDVICLEGTWKFLWSCRPVPPVASSAL